MDGYFADRNGLVNPISGWGSAMEERGRSFDEDIRFFLNACPGPAMARRGLHVAAFQEVRGIPGLERSREDEEPRRGFEGGRSSGQTEGDGSYLRKRTEIAELLGCRPAYLTEAALRHGYQYSRALRWIRFLHGVALRAAGVDSCLARSEGKTGSKTGMTPMVRHRGGYSTCVVGVVLAAACTLDDGIPDSQGPQVTVRDSAGIEVVENHFPEWDPAGFWTVDSEPEFVLGAEGDPSQGAAHRLGLGHHRDADG